VQSLLNPMARPGSIPRCSPGGKSCPAFLPLRLNPLLTLYYPVPSLSHPCPIPVSQRWNASNPAMQRSRQSNTAGCCLPGIPPDLSVLTWTLHPRRSYGRTLTSRGSPISRNRPSTRITRNTRTMPSWHPSAAHASRRGERIQRTKQPAHSFRRSMGTVSQRPSSSPTISITCLAVSVYG